MVSPISSPSQRFCPASGSSISVKKCVAERVLEINCPIDCSFNPFNPSAPRAFDSIVGLGLSGATRWLEKVIKPVEWARRLDAMDRRFGPERDLPLISYEAQWLILSRALAGIEFPEVKRAFEDREGGGLRNDARLVFEKLSRSRAMLLQVVDANEGLPYYTVRSVFEDREFLYVDFGDQEPLEAGTLMFGRFLMHVNCIYVIPGVFVGTADVLDTIVGEIGEYLDEDGDGLAEALDNSLPEIWNICTAIQDERDGEIEGDLPAQGEGSPHEDPCQSSFHLDMDADEVVEALNRHPFFNRCEASLTAFSEEVETIFDVYVLPVSNSPIHPMEGEDEAEYAGTEDDKVVRVGSVYVGRDKMSVTGLNPVELELLKALVFQIIALPGQPLE